MMKKGFILIIAILISLPFILAQDIVITKSISEDIISEGDILGINLEVLNNGTNIIQGSLYDIPREFIEVIKEGSSEVGEDTPGEGLANLQEFPLTISPGELKSVSYKIKFSSIPDSLLDKDFKMSLATFVDSEGNEYFSNDVTIFIKTDKVLVCNYNYECESERGETHENCFQDCLSGASDNYCDGLSDGRCDPDCRTIKDMDCLKSKIKDSAVWIIVGVIVIILTVILIIILKRKSKIQTE